MEKDDGQLLHRILSGDDEAFGILVQKYQKSVHALAWRKIGDFHYAEEITQDTFLQAYNKLSTLKNHKHFAGWLYVITNNLCNDWLRKENSATQPLWDESIGTIDKIAYERYVLEQREKEATEQRHEIVKQLLQKLPESERTVVTLYYLGEMTTKEIGKFLGVSVNTITSRLQRARERLQRSDVHLINETLGGWQLSPNLYKNIMRQVAETNPVPSPTGKPMMPWVAFSAATVLVLLMVGVSNQFLARFQQPFSLDAQAEPTIKIVDSLVVLETDAKPSLRNIKGQNVPNGNNESTGSSISDITASHNSSENILQLTVADNIPKVTHFKLSNGIRVVNLHVENYDDVGIFSYLPLGFVGDEKGKTQWSNLIMHLSVRSSGPIDFKTSNAETMHDNLRFEFIGNTDTWKQGLKLHAKWLSRLPFTTDSLKQARLNALAQIDYVEENLLTHKYAAAAWYQVFQFGQTDIPIRRNIQSAQLLDLQQYRDQNLTRKENVLLCVIGGIDPKTLRHSLENDLGTIKLSDQKLQQPTDAPEILKNQKAIWDIKVSHYIETYPIPQPEDIDYPALYVASLLFNNTLMKEIKLKELVGNIFCGVDLVTPEQSYLYVSASLRPNSDIKIVKQRIRQLMTSLPQSYSNIYVSMISKSISNQLNAPPDINALMQHKPDYVSDTQALLQVGVSWGMLEYRYGENLSRLAKALEDVTAPDVTSVVNRYLTEDRRMTLVLSPRTSE